MEAEWYVFAARRQTGPYTAQDLFDYPDDVLVWRDGMTDWAPKSEVLARSAGPTPPKPPQRFAVSMPAAGERNCCADDTCTGVIAATGRCGTCGRTPDEACHARSTSRPNTQTPTSRPDAHTSERARDASGALGIAALVIGIVALINGCVPFCGAWAILPALVGLVLGCVAIVQRVRTKKPRAVAIAGLVLNSLAVVVVCVLAAVAMPKHDASNEPIASLSDPLTGSTASQTSSGRGASTDEGAAAEAFVGKVVDAVLNNKPEEIPSLLSFEKSSAWSLADLRRLTSMASSLVRTSGGGDQPISATQASIDETPKGARVALTIKSGGVLVGTLRISTTSTRRAIGPDGDLVTTSMWTIDDLEWLAPDETRLWPLSAQEYRAKIAASAIDAKVLWREYEENEVRADGQYKGRSLFVSGKIQSIEKDFLDNVLLQLRSPNEFMPTRAYLSEQERVTASRLSKGDEILLNCRGDGRVMGSPVLRDCTIQ